MHNSTIKYCWIIIMGHFSYEGEITFSMGQIIGKFPQFLCIFQTDWEVVLGHSTDSRQKDCHSCKNLSNKINLYIFWKTHFSGMFCMLTTWSSVVCSCNTLSVTTCTKSGGYESIPWIPGHVIFLLWGSSQEHFELSN